MNIIEKRAKIRRLKAAGKIESGVIPTDLEIATMQDPEASEIIAAAEFDCDHCGDTGCDPEQPGTYGDPARCRVCLGGRWVLMTATIPPMMVAHDDHARVTGDPGEAERFRDRTQASVFAIQNRFTHFNPARLDAGI